MFARVVLAGLIFLGAASPAQATTHPARTGTGGGPETTVTAPHTAPTGQVVPRPHMLSPLPGSTVEETRGRRAKDSHLMKGICVGC